MEEDIKREIELFSREIDYYRERIELQENRTLEHSIDAFTNINKKRHDIFLHIIQEKFGLNTTEGDENPKNRILYELERSNEKDLYEKYIQKFHEDRFRNYNKTPDLVIVKKEHGIIDSIDIIDVTVTFDPSIAVETKIDKYKQYLEMFSELKPNIMIIYYSIRDKEIKHVGYPLHEPLNIDMSCGTEYEKICEDSEQLKLDIKRSLDPKTLEDLNYWLKESRTLEDVTGIPIVENKFAMSTEEFIKALNKNPWFRRFFGKSEMLEGEKELLARSFNYTSIDKSDSHEIDKFVRMVLKDDPSKYKDDEDNRKFFANLENELMSDTITTSSSKIPREPTNQEILDAFEELEKRAIENYNGTDKTKLLSPLYFAFSKNGEYLDKEKGKLLKKRRLQNLYEKIKNSKGDKNLKEALMLILEPVNIEDQKYFDSFMKGECHVTSDGNVINNETFQNLIQQENKNIRDNVKKGVLKPKMTDAFDYKKLVAVSMKKGEVINIRPHKISYINELLDSAGVDRRTEKTFQELRKVKSMRFWDRKDLDKNSEEFIKKCKSLTKKLISVGEKINDKQFEEFKTYSTGSGSDSEDSVSSKAESTGSSEKSDDLNKIRESFERGMKFYMRYNEILWENLSFAAHMGGNGFRIVQGITHNNFLLVMPCESIMKGMTGVPFINISIEESSKNKTQSDVFEDHCDLNRKTLEGTGYKVHISMGRRLDRPRLQGYLNIKPMFYTAVSILNHYRSESNLRSMDMLEQTMLALIIGNVNINTSSILDNTRYMLENTMADYSFCKEFIEDKFMVPCKNIAQMYLFSRVKKVLINVREETSKARVKKSTISEDGSINIDTSRVIKADISSYLFSDIKYKKPEFVIGEVYTLFFSIQKGLHGHFHNLLDTHRTPIEIQDEINKKFGNKIPRRMSTPEDRLEFNPRSMVLATIEADKNLTDSNRHIRQLYSSRSRINECPLMIKTMTSTRSVMVEDKRNENSNIETSELEISPLISELNSNETSIIIKKIYDLNEKLHGKKKNETRKIWRKFRDNIDKDEDINKFTGLARLQTIDLVKNKIKVNYDTTSLEFRKDQIRNDYKSKIRAYQSEHMYETKEDRDKNKSNLKFYTSGTVLTQVLDHTIKTRKYDESNNLKFISQGEISKNAVLKESVKFLIRQKHQRTQKDREIFVGNKAAKDILYPIEHFYKQKCFHLTEEKISEPGDLKIISMSKQVRSGFEWMAKEYIKMEKERNKETNELTSEYRCDSFHFNLDMTKWAPKDNLFKFIYTIAPCSISTFKEKLFFIASIFKMADKDLYIDDELFFKLMTYRNIEVNVMDGKEDINKEGDPFTSMTDNFKRNEVKVVESWFQGQMNYLSSYVHAGTLLLWKKFTKRRWSNINMLFYMNCHSDDQQSDVYTVRHKSIKEEELLASLWSMMDYLMRNNCMEISIKKSYISKLIKQFISQYNIAGEQIYLWCKPIMSAISGCPYTTLKDDMSSMFSKVAEALSKGAPKNVASVVINEMRTILWDTYGIRTKNQGNKFSALMSIPEENLPMAYGGSYVRDYTTLAIGGPKTIDQMNLYNLIQKCGGTTERQPTRLPSGDVLRSLQVFYVTDLLTSETIEEEEDSSATLTLNPFRPTKFKSRRLGNEDPFKFNMLYSEDKEEQLKAIKEYNPGLGLVKPNTPDDLLAYYMILYNTPNFKSALAGQSPIILRLQKIINRKKGVFRFKKSGNITLEKFSDSEDLEVFNADQVSKLITSMMKSIPMSIESVELIRLKYIVSDPEFRVLAFTSQHAQSTSAVLRKNPIPKKKPNSSDYSNVVNKLNLLLCYFFDEKYFERNKYKIQFPVALSNDLMRINELFPVEFSWLRKQISNYKNLEATEKDVIINNKYINYLRVFEEIKKVESDIIVYSKMLSINDIRYKKHKELIDKVAEIEFIKAKGGSSTELEPVMTYEEYKKNGSNEKNKLDIFVRLVNCAKLISTRTQKVIFCSPTQSNELHELALATKTIIESSIDLSISYYLNVNQRQELRNLKLAFFRAEKAKMIDFIMQSSNLIELMYQLGCNLDDIKRVVNTVRMKDIDIETVKENFKDIYQKYKQASIVMIGLKSPDTLSYYISLMDPIQIKWDIEQVSRSDPFSAHMHYENMIIRFFGDKGKVTAMEIQVTGQIFIPSLNKAIKSFCADLLYRDPKKYSSILLAEVLQLNSIDKNKVVKLAFAISSVKNEIVEGNHHTASYYMPNVKIQKSEIPKIAPKIVESYVNHKPLGVKYKSSINQFGDEEFIKHRWFRDYQITELEFEDFDLSGYLLSDLATKSMFRPIITGRYMDLTSEEVVKFNRFPFRMLSEEGTFGSFYTFRLATGDINDDFNRMTNWIQAYFNMIDDINKKIKYSDSDTDDEHSYALKERMDAFSSSDYIVEYANKYKADYISADFTENQSLMDSKEEVWDDLMFINNKYDLRSVRRAFIIVKIMQNKNEDIEEGVSYSEMFNEMDIIEKNIMVKQLKDKDMVGDMQNVLISECQLTKFNKYDQLMFNNILSLLITIYKMGKNKKKDDKKFNVTFFNLIRNHTDPIANKNAKRTKGMIVAVCCYHLGSKFLEFCEDIGKFKFDRKQTYDMLCQTYKIYKIELSEHIITLWEIVNNSYSETTKRLINESTLEQFNLVDRYQTKKRGKRGKLNVKEVMLRQSTSKEKTEAEKIKVEKVRQTTSKSIKLTQKLNPDLEELSKEDPDALLQLVAQSKEIKSTDISTEWTASETESKLALIERKKKSKRKSLLDMVNEIGVEKPEIVEIDLDLGEEKFEDGEDDFGWINEDDFD